jgi:thiosulfate oxidation carrier complex protein SoxZ
MTPDTPGSRFPKTASRGVWTRRGVLCGGVGAGLGLLGAPLGADEIEMRAAITSDFGAPTLADGQIEIVMPEFSDSGKSVPMDIFVPCAMTAEAHPRVVRVYAARNPRPRVVAFYFTPECGEARISTRIRVDAFQDVVAIVEMADGSRFQGVRRVDVTYGACEDAVANDQFPPGWAPSIRISVPERVAAGEIFPVRTIINHPMETGFRHNQSGLLIPVRIAEQFRCRVGDRTLFSADLEPAIATNPYFAFSLRLQESAELTFEWIDTTGEVYTGTASVAVG